MGTPVNTKRQALLEEIADLEAELEDARENLQYYVPVEPTEEGSVIRFRKYDQAYIYAAVRGFDSTSAGPWVKVYPGIWYVTQDGTRTSRQGIGPKSWNELIEWIGEQNWDTIEVLS